MRQLTSYLGQVKLSAYSGSHEAMPSKLKSAGILFAVVFFAGYCLNVITKAFRGDSFVMTVIGGNSGILLATIALFLLSAFIDKLRWIQPALFIGLSSIPISQDTRSLYGLGFFVVGILLLERAGYLLARRGLKLILLTAYLIGLNVRAVLVNKGPFIDAAGPSFFMLAFGLFLWFLYKDRLVVYLKEPKQKLSLTEKGFTPAERTYTLAVVGGKTMKEIGYDFELSESTIRNTLAKAYKKLGVEDRAGLAALAEKYEFVE
jgi:DNA-binding CsgD family transcriptional regulator